MMRGARRQCGLIAGGTRGSAARRCSGAATHFGWSTGFDQRCDQGRSALGCCGCDEGDYEARYITVIAEDSGG